VEYNTCRLCPFIDLRWHVLISLQAMLRSYGMLFTDPETPFPAFDLPIPILLEYLLERFFEAGEGAKAV
jgi:hypothetical protein